MTQTILAVLLLASTLGCSRNAPEDEADGVVLYATEWCGYCRKARRFLQENDIPFVEYDIEKSAEGRRQYEALNGRGIPLLKVKGTVIRGYSPEAIMAALE